MHQNGGIPKSFTVNLRRKETKEIIHSISDFADHKRASKVGPLVNKTNQNKPLSLVKQDVTRVLFSLSLDFMFRVMTLWNLDVIWLNSLILVNSISGYWSFMGTKMCAPGKITIVGGIAFV